MDHLPDLKDLLMELDLDEIPVDVTNEPSVDRDYSDLSHLIDLSSLYLSSDLSLATPINPQNPLHTPKTEPSPSKTKTAVPTPLNKFFQPSEIIQKDIEMSPGFGIKNGSSSERGIMIRNNKRFDCILTTDKHNCLYRSVLIKMQNISNQLQMQKGAEQQPLLPEKNHVEVQVMFSFNKPKESIVPEVPSTLPFVFIGIDVTVLLDLILFWAQVIRTPRLGFEGR